MILCSRRGGQARSWGAADQYGFTLGESVYIGSHDRRRRSYPGQPPLRNLARPPPPPPGSRRQD